MACEGAILAAMIEPLTDEPEVKHGSAEVARAIAG